MNKICEEIVKKLQSTKKTIAFMESCTGGYLANEITNIPGASNVLKVSLITYSNEYKIKLGVDEKIIDKYTVYSMETAMNMAKSVKKFANSNYGIGITGELGNTNKKENRVYYSIYDGDKKTYINEELLIDLDDRKKMKENVAYRVYKKLLEAQSEE